jgi:hypothetical protein
MDILTILLLVDILIYAIIQVLVLRIIFEARAKVIAARHSQQECSGDNWLEGDTARYLIWRAFDPEAEDAWPPRIKALWFGFALMTLILIVWVAYAWFRERDRLTIAVVIGMILTRYSALNVISLQYAFGSPGTGRNGKIAGQTNEIDARYTKIVNALNSGVVKVTAQGTLAKPMQALTGFAPGYVDELRERYLMNHPEERSSSSVDAKINGYLSKKENMMDFVALTNPNMDRRWAESSSPEYESFFRALAEIKNKNMYNPDFDMRMLFTAIEANTWTIAMAVIYAFAVGPFMYRTLVGYPMYRLMPDGR